MCACVIPWDPTAAAVPRVDSRGGHSAFCNLFFVFAIHACLLLLLCACITPKAFDVVGCGSHGITAVAVLQGLRFVTATNGASVCACVRIMWQCHSVHNERQFQPTLPLNFKSIRAVQRQRYNSGTTPVNLAKLIYTGTPVFPHVKLRHPRDFKSTTSRRGTL